MGSAEITDSQETPDETSIPSPVLLTGMARQAWRLYRANAGGLILTFVPFLILSAAAFFGVELAIGLNGINLLLLVLLRDLIHIVVVGFGMGAAIVYLADRVAGRPVRARDALKDALSSSHLLAPGILLAAVPYCLTIFIVGPVLRELFVGPPILVTVILLERERVGPAMTRTSELMTGSWSRMILYLITFSAGIGLLDFIAEQFALRAITATATNALGYALAVAVSVIIPAILVAYVACVWLIAYFDLRARTEDFTKADLPSLRPRPAG